MRTVHPPHAVLLVGAGDGAGPWVERLQEWAPGQVTLVEADEAQFRQLQGRVEERPGWTLLPHVVSGACAEVPFHQASLALESGLLAPESLRPLWPHLATRQVRTRRATTLGKLLREADSAPNWLVLDCLPALTLLEGAEDRLQHIDVVAARVLLGAEPIAAGPAGFQALQTWLEARGFLSLGTESGRHPAIGQALFVRDMQASVTTLSRHLGEAARQQQRQAEELLHLQAASTQQKALASAEIARLDHARQQALEAADLAAQTQQERITQLERALADQAIRAEAAAAAAQLAHADTVAQLTRTLQAAEQLAVERHRMITQLRQAAAQTEAATAAENQRHADEAARLTQAGQAAETRTHAQQQQIALLEQSLADLAAGHKAEVDTAQQAHADEVTRLTSTLQAAEKLAAERHRMITQLRQAAAQTEAANVAQAQTHADERTRWIHASEAAEAQAQSQQQRIEQLQQTLGECTALQHGQAEEFARLTAAQQAAEKLASERHRTIAQLRQAATQASAQAESAASAQSKLHQDDVARLTQAQKQTDERLKAAVKQQQDLAAQAEKLTQSRATAEKQIAELRARTAPAQVARSRADADADIDDLLDDISAFFTERAITYVDVGAYVGEVFLKLAQSRKLKVREAHLYEPNPTSYQTLTQALASCRLPTLHAYHLAVGAKPELLHFNAAQSMTRVVEPEPGSPQISNTFTAQSVSLDEQARLFTDQKVNLLKIDVEGRELDVLMGATGLLASQRIDMLYIEVGLNRQGTQQTYFADVDRFLQEKGYRVFRIYEQMNEWTEDSPLLRRCNVAYMSEHFARSNPSKLTRRLQSLQEELQRLKTTQTVPLMPVLT